LFFYNEYFLLTPVNDDFTLIDFTFYLPIDTSKIVFHDDFTCFDWKIKINRKLLRILRVSVPQNTHTLLFVSNEIRFSSLSFLSFSLRFLSFCFQRFVLHRFFSISEIKAFDFIFISLIFSHSFYSCLLLIMRYFEFRIR